jgi:hypothetical protein
MTATSISQELQAKGIQISDCQFYICTTSNQLVTLAQGLSALGASTFNYEMFGPHVSIPVAPAKKKIFHDHGLNPNRWRALVGIGGIAALCAAVFTKN